MLNLLEQTPTLLIASVPLLVARTLHIGGHLVLLVNRSLQTAMTDEVYQPVVDFLKKYPHSIQFGPKVIRDEDMAGGSAEMTIYRLDGA